MKHRSVPAMFVATLAALVLTPALASAAQPCESLASVRFPETTITLAAAVPAGQFTPPAAPGAAQAPALIEVPAFCRVQLTVAPSIKIEVWMPAASWNGNFQGVGTGGY